MSVITLKLIRYLNLVLQAEVLENNFDIFWKTFVKLSPKKVNSATSLIKHYTRRLTY